MTRLMLCYVMTCYYNAETIYDDAHIHRTGNTIQTNNCRFMDIWALGSEFCNVQNNIAIYKIGDSFVYIALGGSDILNFVNLFGSTC